MARNDATPADRTVSPAGLVYGRIETDPHDPNTGLTGTSIFDPVLCELAYRWFCPPGGLVLDPFAGGSVRGIVASRLGRRYLGVDLSARQIAANEDQARRICRPPAPLPEWRCGDARDLRKIAADVAADFVFTCPPYWNLERYSDDERDLSTLDDFEEFFAAYCEVVAAATALLRPDRFACFVVGDVREPRTGYYCGLPGRTCEAFRRAGLMLYNEAILVTPAGSLPIRAAKQFETSRKLGKTHQNFLAFVKGDARAATAAIGPVEFGELFDDAPDALADEPAVAYAPAPAGVETTLPTRWKVSAAWARRAHECNLAGILRRCHGGCCRTASFWPPRAFAHDDGTPTTCGRLGPGGCTYAPADKPVVCHLYPLTLNDSGTLVLHHRATTHSGVCKGNHGEGPPLIVALADNLIHLFGAEQYERVRAAVLTGQDSYFDPPPAVVAALNREHDWAATKTPPEPRSAFSPPPTPAPSPLPPPTPAPSSTSSPTPTPTTFFAPASVALKIIDPPTPIEAHGKFWLKRDDLYEFAGVRGGKVRTCRALADGAPGLITAGSRASPQVNIVAHVARALGVPCRVHVPGGALAPEVVAARECGAEVVQHSPGYTSVIIARGREDAKACGWREIPFGMECGEAVQQTAAQVGDWPDGVRRVVVPVGSGMTLAGVLAGLDRAGRDTPVVGVVVGGDPTKRLDRFAPAWRGRCTLVRSPLDYHAPAPVDRLGDVVLDPIYEAKCLPFLVAGDLLWCVGIRQTAAKGE